MDVPAAILRKWGDRFDTNFNGEYASLSAKDKEAVLAELVKRGFRVTEEPEIMQLAGLRY
jgi:hypothetical protein